MISDLSYIYWPALVIGITYLVFTPFYRTPLYQDQSLHFYTGKKWLEGKIPYRDLTLSMGPHFGLIYSLGYLLCKNNEILFNIYSVGIVAAGNVFLFLTANMLFGLLPALIASCLFALYSFSPRFVGDRTPPENYVNVSCIAALYFYFLGMEYASSVCFFVSGFFISSATLTRQTTYFYVPVLLGGLIFSKHFLGIMYYFAGFILIQMFWLSYFANKGFMKGYLRNTILHIFYVAFFGNVEGPGQKSTDPVRKRGASIYRLITGHSYTILPVYLIASAFIFYHFSIDPSFEITIILMMAIIGIFLIFPRRNFDCNYWLNTVPWASILAGASIGLAINRLPHSDPLVRSLLIFMGFGYIFYFFTADYRYYATFDPEKRDLLIDPQKKNHASWWPTFNAIGKYIAERTAPEVKVAVLGHAARIYNVSGRDAFFYSIGHIPFKQKARNRGLYDQFYEKMKVDYPEVIVLAGHMPAYPFNPEPYLNDMDEIQKISGMFYSVRKIIDNFPIYFVDIEKSYIRALIEGGFKNARLENEKHRISGPTLKLEKDLRCISRPLAFIGFISDLKAGKRFKDLIYSIAEIGKSGFKEFSREELQSIQFLAGEALFEMGDLKNAENTFHKIINNHPENIEAYNNLGVVYFKQGKFTQAESMFRQALSMDPENIDAEANLSAMNP